MTSRDEATAARTETLRLEAAAWFARMRREDNEQFRPEFESWLADPEHRRAYNRLAARFSDAKILNRGAAGMIAVRSPVRRRGAIAILVAALAMLALSFMIFVMPKPPAPAPAIQTARLEGRSDAITRFRLRDGSVVTLDRDALVRVRLDRSARTLLLEHGRARFAVAHGNRPFAVDAGSGTIVARGTIFDVAFTGEQTDVALIEGAVDVTAQGTGNTNARRLQAGQSVALARGRINDRPGFTAPRSLDWPQAMADVRGESVEALLARANRLSVIKITVTDAKLAATRVSGRFRLDDPMLLGANLARLLDLDVAKRDTHIILSPRARKKNPSAA